MKLKIFLSFAVVFVLFSSFVFAYETVFDWTLTWDKATAFSSAIGKSIGSSVEHYFSDDKDPYIVDWIRFDMSNSRGRCGNIIRIIFQDENKNEIKHRDFGSSGTLYIGNETGNFIYVTKIGGIESYEVKEDEDCWHPLDCLLKLFSKPKKKTINCDFNYAVGVKFMDPVTYSNTTTISDDCPQGKGTDCPRDFGKIVDFISPVKTTAVKVFSTNNQVLVWMTDTVGSTGYSKQTSKSISSDYNDHVYACLDSDRNSVCDFEQIGECEDSQINGAWYKDNCCMDASIITPTGFKQKKLTPGFHPGIGICGKDVSGRFKWAPLEAGVFSELDLDPGIKVVSDGQRYYDCGGSKVSSLPTSIASLVSKLDLLTVSRTVIATPLQINQPRQYVADHSFLCNRVVYECAGDDIYLSRPSSDLKRSKIGDKLTDSKGSLKYCTDDGKWDSNLDTPGRSKACNNAGFNHTGTKCCGEPEDKPEYYNDKGQNGACWDSNVIMNGNFAIGMRNIISHKGVLTACNVNDPKIAAITDSYTKQKLVADVTDGEFLEKTTKTGESATCQPYGNFTFTKSGLKPTSISAVWDVTKEGLTTIHQNGFCDSNTECWNGVDCQGTKTFYLSKDKSFGFVCV